ncbi:hypothetical protein EKH55_0886 [Sinorhizobium alkalisoli]|nr:hypothetical protein EKH55_0886 [Sinorhizobium alkalisoli]
MSDTHIVARDQLRGFIERIERLEEEKKSIADDIKDVYGEAKSMGFDTKILRKVISIRKQDADERAEQEAILDTYLHALGMIQMDMFEEPEPDGGAVAAVKGNARLANAAGVEPPPSERIDPTTGEILDDMKAKSRQRMTDGMADHKALSSALAKDGLISEEAHAENVKLADAVAQKYGNGVRADGGLDIVTKHTEIATASQGEAAAPSDERVSPTVDIGSAGANAGGEDVDGSAERASPVATSSGPDGKRATNSPEEANETVGGFPVAAAPTSAEETGVDGRDAEEANGNVAVKSVTAGETATNSRAKASDDNAAISAKTAPAGREMRVGEAGRDYQPATSDDGRDSLERQAPIPTAKPKTALRPRCRNPEACAGYGDRHCHACTVAMREKAEEVA